MANPISNTGVLGVPIFDKEDTGVTPVSLMCVLVYCDFSHNSKVFQTGCIILWVLYSEDWGSTSRFLLQEKLNSISCDILLLCKDVFSVSTVKKV